MYSKQDNSKEVTSNYNIILLTQEPGYLNPVTGIEVGNRSCALIQNEHQKIGNNLVQFKIEDCKVSLEGDFLYRGNKIDIQSFQGVVLRTWGDNQEQEKAINVLMPYLEKHGLYPDNSVDAIKNTISKKQMQAAIENAKANCPLTLVIEQDKFDKSEFLLFVKQLQETHKKKSLDKSYPAYVVKPDAGTHGNGVEMFFVGEEDKLYNYIESVSKKEICVLQEYVKPAFSMIEKQENEACSAHYRIIMSRQNDNSFTMIGGLFLQRTGSWVSNTHCPKGELHKRILSSKEVPQSLLETLAQIANNINLNQFGADVLIDDFGAFYILELNDGMGISGPLLEKQQISTKYIQSHISRLKLHLENQKQETPLLSEKGFFSTSQNLNSTTKPSAIQFDL